MTESVPCSTEEIWPISYSLKTKLVSRCAYNTLRTAIINHEAVTESWQYFTQQIVQFAQNGHTKVALSYPTTEGKKQIPGAC